MGLLDKIFTEKQDSSGVLENDLVNRQETPIRMYNHVDIAKEYAEYKKGKKSYDIQEFQLWLLETYPNMLFIKRD